MDKRARFPLVRAAIILDWCQYMALSFVPASACSHALIPIGL